MLYFTSARAAVPAPAVHVTDASAKPRVDPTVLPVSHGRLAQCLQCAQSPISPQHVLLLLLIPPSSGIFLFISLRLSLISDYNSTLASLKLRRNQKTSYMPHSLRFNLQNCVAGFFSIFLLLVATVSAYDVVKDYSGLSFFDEWDFYGSWDNLTLG